MVKLHHGEESQAEHHPPGDHHMRRGRDSSSTDILLTAREACRDSRNQRSRWLEGCRHAVGEGGDALSSPRRTQTQNLQLVRKRGRRVGTLSAARSKAVGAVAKQSPDLHVRATIGIRARSR